MSMSTRIDDLPDMQLSEEPMNKVVQPQRYMNEEDMSSVKAKVKKKVKFADTVEEFENEEKEEKSLFSDIINENNLLILVFLFIATLSSTTMYMRKIPFIGMHANGEIASGLIKALLLFILYIVIKSFVLPKIKL